MRFNLKIFQIDRNFYELLNKTSQEIVEIIRENHKKGLKAEDQDFEVVKPSLKSHIEGDFEFWTYAYNQPKELSYWESFLPNELSKDVDFKTVEFSFVLFVIYKNEIYCTVGGSGFNVIKKYIDNNFGIDLYQHFAKPAEDIIMKVSSRGVAGNISQRDNTFNYDQRISESLEYSEIPKKMKVIVRDELKKGIFQKYNLDDDKSIMEIGSYFTLKKQLSFKELKQLVFDIELIKSDKSNYVQLTLFTRIDDSEEIENLDNQLMERLVDNVLLHNTPLQLNDLNKDIIELVNSSKLEKFYECDEFKVRFKKTWSKNDLMVTNKESLFFECTKHIFNHLENINDRFKIKGLFYDLNIIGQVNGKDSTFGNFYSHVVCEMTYNSRKYFRIDAKWYFLNDKFLEQIKKDAISTYQQNKLELPLLLNWQKGWDEDTYNKKHKKKNYFILDKVIKDNIELCDILILENNTLYFVHVKNAFNTQMRNLYIQVTLSAKRLWNDLYNNTGSSYLKTTLKKHNNLNKNNKIDIEEVYNKIIEDEYKIEFVMAYNNYAYNGKTPEKKIELSESNIAKYSLVQTVREMRDYRRFGIKVIDISGI
jgi:uncharacterized protein (TIGR04141 family)